MQTHVRTTKPRDVQLKQQTTQCRLAVRQDLVTIDFGCEIGTSFVQVNLAASFTVEEELFHHREMSL